MGLGSKVGPGNKVGLGNKIGPPIHILPAGYTLTGYYIALSIGPFVGMTYSLTQMAHFFATSSRNPPLLTYAVPYGRYARSTVCMHRKPVSN